MSGNLPVIRYQSEQYIRISGKIVKKTGTPATGATLTVHSLTDISAILDTITDGEGRFSFDRLAFYDSTRLIVQARNDKGKQNVNILLDELPAQAIGTNKNAPDASPDINQSISDYLKNRDEQFGELQKYGLMDLGYLLDEVTITAKKSRLSEIPLISWVSIMPTRLFAEST